MDEDGDYSVVSFRKTEGLVETINSTCERIRDSIQGLIETYSHAFRVDFKLRDPTIQQNSEFALIIGNI